MAIVDRTEALQLWSKRIGGGYPTLEECERAAELLGDGHVLIGPPHPVYGYFMVPHPAPINETTKPPRIDPQTGARFGLITPPKTGVDWDPNGN